MAEEFDRVVPGGQDGWPSRRQEAEGERYEDAIAHRVAVEMNEQTAGPIGQAVLV